MKRELTPLEIKTMGMNQAEIDKYIKDFKRKQEKFKVLFAVGHASEVGSKEGEMEQEQSLYDTKNQMWAYDRTEYAARQKLDPSSHMTIINEHNQIVVRQALGDYLREMFASHKERDTCLGKYCPRLFPVPAFFINSDDIDRYIDEYFLFQVPDFLSVGENHLKVHELLRCLLVQEHDLTMYESEARMSQSVGSDYEGGENLEVPAVRQSQVMLEDDD